MLRIVTDSASDITKEQAEQMRVEIIPLNIQFTDGPFVQETEADIAAFYERLEQAEELPTTSQPSPERYAVCFEAARAAGDDVLVLTLSSGLSGTVNAANIGKEMSEYDRVWIVDSHHAITTQRALTEYAVKLRDAGVSTEEVVEQVKAMRERVTVSGVIDTLTFLRKGGRIPTGLAVVGNALKIKPVILLEDKIIKTIGKAMGKEAGKRMLWQRLEKLEPDPEFPFYFVYTSDREAGEEFMAQTIEKFGLQDYQTRLVPIGSVIGTHLGTNAFGLGYTIKN